MNDHSTDSNARFVRRAVLGSVLLTVLLVAGIYLWVQLRPLLAADAALDAAFAQDYEPMQASLDTLEALNQPELYYQTVLDCAKLADYNGRHELALALLERPEPRDTDAYIAFARMAQEQAPVYTYHQAMALYEQGDYALAARTAAQARDYEAARALYDMAQTAYQASLPTPTPTPVPTPTPTPSPTPEPAAPAQTPKATPEPVVLLPEGRLAAGFAHTVVLMEDGTVRAFGDNSRGQLNVDSWRNVVAVAAGAYHTLGLTADGSVLACGDNEFLQLDVAFYRGVKAIAAGDYASFLLLDNGQVISTGYLSYAFLNDLTGVQSIWAGSYGLLAKTAKGLFFSHPGLAVNAECKRFAVSRGYAVGADAAGDTFSSTDLLPQWTGIARLAASENGVVALTQYGQVLSHLFDRHSKAVFTFSQPVLAIAAAPNHYAFLLADQTLEIRHSNGETETYNLN